MPFEDKESVSHAFYVFIAELSLYVEWIGMRIVCSLWTCKTCVRGKGNEQAQAHMFALFLLLFRLHPMSTRAKGCHLQTVFIITPGRHISLLLLSHFFGFAPHFINLTHTHTPPSLLYFRASILAVSLSYSVTRVSSSSPSGRSMYMYPLVRIPRREPIVCQLIIIRLLC